MKALQLLLFTLLFIQFTYSQKIYWPSSFGGENGGGSMVSYDLTNGSFEEPIELESNALGMYHLYTNNYNVSNESHDLVTEGNGLFMGSDGYIYGLDQYVGLNTANAQQGIDAGLLYRFHPDSLKIEPLHYFQKSRHWEDDRIENKALEKSYSSPRLGIRESNGKIYGLCIRGGSNNHGGVWGYDLTTHQYTELKDFVNSQDGIGFDPSSPLCSGPNNDLFFILNVSRGTYGNGALIQIDVSQDTVGFAGNLHPSAPGFTTLGIYFPNGNLIYDQALQRFFGAKKYDFYPTGGGVYTYNFNPQSGSVTNVTNNVGIFTDYPLLGSSLEGMVLGNDGNKYAVTTHGGQTGKGCLLIYSNITHTLTRITDFIHSPNGNSLFAHGTKIWGTYIHNNGVPTHSLWSYDVTTGILENHIQTNSQYGYRVEPQLAISNDGIYMAMKIGGIEGEQHIVKYDFATESAQTIISGGSNSSKFALGSVINIGSGEFLGLSRYHAPGLGYSHQEGCLIKYNLNTNSSEILKPVQAVSPNYTSIVGYSPLTDNSPELILGNNKKVYFTSSTVGNSFFSFITPGYTPRKLLWEYDIDNDALKIVDSLNLYSWGPKGSPFLISNGDIAYTSYAMLRVYNPITEQVTEYSQLIDESLYGGFNGQLIEANDGNLYGVSSRSENYSATARSTIFKLETSNNYSFSELYQFDSTIVNTNESLVEYNGKLYGSTSSGGANNFGYLFSFDITTNTFNTEYSFQKGQDGADFDGKWLLINDSLIGISSTGGLNNVGTIAIYDIGDNQFSKLEDLSLRKGFGYKASPILFDDATLSMTENQSGEVQLNVYPNPAKNAFKISTNSAYDGIIIFDLQGRNMGGYIKSNEYSAENLKSGVYVVRIYNNNQVLGSRKLTIK